MELPPGYQLCKDRAGTDRAGCAVADPCTGGARPDIAAFNAATAGPRADRGGCRDELVCSMDREVLVVGTISVSRGEGSINCETLISRRLIPHIRYVDESFSYPSLEIE